MRFLQHQQITGLAQPPKSQTRRLVKADEFAVNEHGVNLPRPVFGGDEIDAVYSAMGHKKWQVHHKYAVQRPDGKTVGHTPPIREIRQERLGDINWKDCQEEGIDRFVNYPGDWRHQGFTCPICGRSFRFDPVPAFACLWNHCGGNWERDRDKQVFVLDWGER